MNIYEFFRKVAVQYLANHGISPEDESVRVSWESLRSAYWSAEKPDYGDAITCAAYALCYAPKHAIMWRELTLRFPAKFRDNKLYNSLGTGPGSELIGLLEGANSGRRRVEIRCLEPEETWREIFELVCAEYSRERDCFLDVQYSRNPDVLTRGPVIGSLVLSEVGRHGSIKEYLDQIGRYVAPAVGFFLDFPSCPRTGGANLDIRGHLQSKATYIPDLHIGLWKTINQEMRLCRPLYCERKLREEPKMCIYPWQFL